jgi:hypothetical protein
MTWLAICDRCGFKKQSSELRKEWTGLMVCADTCFEARHPQDFVRGVPDKQAPPWVRPEPADVFVTSYYRREDDGTVMHREDGTPLLREN